VPGIGKSRLVAAVAERIAGVPPTRLRYQCSPYHTNSALRPFIAQLERAAGFKADDTSEQRLDKLEAVLAMGASRVEAVAPLFAALLSIPLGERYPPLALSPTQQRRRTLAALLDQFEGLARRQPILLSFEDAHWADATSLELLDLTVERVRQLPVLTTTVRRATVVVRMSTSETTSAEVVPAVRRPSLLVSARLSSGVCIPARHGHRSGTSRAGENQSASYRQPGPGRMGLAAETEMDEVADVQPLCPALRPLRGHPRAGHHSLNSQVPGPVWLKVTRHQLPRAPRAAKPPRRR
jgi:AAA ATPase domain